MVMPFAHIMARERTWYSMVTLVVYSAWIVAFEAVGRYAATLPTRDLTTMLDRHIPLAPAFVVPYELCYVFPFLPLLVMKDWHRFNQALLAVVLANLSAFLVYLVLPISFPKPELGSTIAERVLALEYAVDFQPGANKLPSLHVTFAWLVFLATRGQCSTPLGQALVLAVAVAISASALLVKQHIVVDVVAGVVWAFGAWALAKHIYARLADSTSEPRVALRHVAKRLRVPALVYVGAIALLLFSQRIAAP